MKELKGQLYAIYKNDVHKGNERALSKKEAIEAYIIASGLSELLDEKSFISQYSAEIAINGFHHHFIN